MNPGFPVCDLRVVRRCVEALAVSGLLLAVPTFAADTLRGQVLGGETLSTLGSGQRVTVFFGMGKPVKTPMIGPAKAP
jgi:hypothetical protein